MNSISSGNSNIGIGQYTLNGNTTGSFNTAIGVNAGYSGVGHAGDYNTYLGYNTALGIVSGNANTIIGANVSGLPAALSNTIILADGNGNQRLYINNNGYAGFGTTSPGARIEINSGLSNSSGLRFSQLNSFSTTVSGNGTALTVDNIGNVVLTTMGGGSGSGWLLTGNSGTVDGTNFIGTTDNIPFNIRVNNQKAGRIDPTSFNTFYGYTAGNITVGNNNSAFGFQALFSNTTGHSNMALGNNSLYANTSGVNNIGIGLNALYSNTTGYQNIAIGTSVLNSNTIGLNNTGIGVGSLAQNTVGSYNTGLGQAALGSNTIGNGNSAVGMSALQLSTTGAYNTANGYSSMLLNTSGSYNTSSGYNSLSANTTGSNNLALGANADVAWGYLTNATAIGYGALVKASYTMQLGNGQVTTIYAGTGTTATLVTGGLQVTGGSLVPGYVLTSNSSGVATWQPPSGGGGGAAWLLTGNPGTIDGTNYIGTTDNVPFNIRVHNLRAGRLDQTLLNTFYGIEAGNNGTSGINNTAIGTSSLATNTTGHENAALGLYSLYLNTTGFGNTAVGSATLSLNTTGEANSAVGNGSLFNNTIGIWNAGLGANALGNNGTGSYNTGCGESSLWFNSSGSFNSALGFDAGVPMFATFGNATAIGAQAIVNAGNKIRLGDPVVTQVEGPIYITTSDGRFKENIREEDVIGLDFINRLRPVVYNFNTRSFEEFLTQGMPDSIRNRYFAGKDFEPSTSIRQSGFIAQEVEVAAQESGYNFNGLHVPESETDYYGLAYGQFVVPLVKSVQELSEKNKQMEKTIEEQRNVNELLKKSIDELRSMIKNISSENKEGSIKITGSNAEAQLFQNAPNPFNKSTVIRYSIPSDARRAIIVINTLDGIKVSEYNLTSKNGQNIEITGGSLSTGTYIYSLFVDDKLIDSKKMILTR